MPVDEAQRHVAYAWLTYEHAHYAQLLRALPALLDAAHATPGLLCPRTGSPPASSSSSTRRPRLARRRPGRRRRRRRPVRAGAATIAVAQALRALGRDRLALTAAVAAAGTAADDGVRGTLLLQAAMAAAGCGDSRRVEDLLDHADVLADRRTAATTRTTPRSAPSPCCWPASSPPCTSATPTEAVHHHEQAIRHDDWPRLPAEHRAAHLIDAARAYLQTGDLAAAGRALAAADTIAPAEVRYRPAARTLIAEIAHHGPAAATVARLATHIGLTR